MNLCPDIYGVPLSIDALSAVCPHAIIPYVSALRSLRFNAVFNHRDLPNDKDELRGFITSRRAAVSSSRLLCPFD